MLVDPKRKPIPRREGDLQVFALIVMIAILMLVFAMPASAWQ